MSAINKSSIARYFGFNGDPVKIRDDCKTAFYSKKDGVTSSRGGYGSISEVCLKSKCSYIAKIIPLAIPSIKESFFREAVIAPVMGKLGIGPVIHDVFTCLNAGFIIMDAWEGSIGNLLDNKIKEKVIDENIMSKIYPLIDRIHRLGIIHNDLHTGNVLYKKHGEKYKFCITDFGLSLRFNDINEVLPSSKLPNTSSPNIYFPSFDYWRLSKATELRAGIPFYTYFIDIGKINLLEYILVDKFWERDNKYDGTTFLDYLHKTKIAKNMTRSLPETPDEKFPSLVKSGNKVLSLIKSTKKKDKNIT